MALIQYLTQIQIEPGARKLLAGECERVGMRRPLVVTDAGVKAAGVLAIRARRAARDAARGLCRLRRDAVQPDRGGGARGDEPVRRPRLRRPRRGRRRLVDRLRQGRRDRGAPRRGARDLRDDRRRQRAHHGRRGAADRGADDGGHRQRGRARRDRHRRRRAQARLPLVAPDAARGDLRSGAHARPAAAADRRHRHGRDRALHGDLHVGGLQSARRRHRARRPRARLVAHRAGDARRARHRRAAADDERVGAGRARVPEGARLRAFAEPLARRRRPAPAPRHAQRRLPAGGDPLQRERADDAARSAASNAWRRRWAWRARPRCPTRSAR